MAIGDRIKRVRNLRGLTQKELGIAIGFDDKTADVRVAQYESGTRTPKEDMLKIIAETLDVNFRSIYEPTLYAAEDIMYTLFELDEHHPISVSNIEEKGELPHKAIVFESKILDDFFTEWQLRKKELDEGKINREEYMEWKLNWPATADDCGKVEPTKQWRKIDLSK